MKVKAQCIWRQEGDQSEEGREVRRARREGQESNQVQWHACMEEMPLWGWRDGSVVKSINYLLEDMGSILSIHMAAHSRLELQFQEKIRRMRDKG